VATTKKDLIDRIAQSTGDTHVVVKAVTYLIRMEELAAAAGIRPQQAQFVEDLRKAHGRKTSFWAKVKKGS
jgi:hypothetical protein